MQQGQWQWQEAGTSWKGVGIYHLTLTLPSRKPLLGTLVIPDNDPALARVEATDLGHALLECLRNVPLFYPEIQILQYCLMPDHLHSIWYVRRPMEKSIRYVAQGFWRAAKKAGRAWTYLHGHNLRLTGGATNESAAATAPAAPCTAATAPAAPCAATFPGAAPAAPCAAAFPGMAPGAALFNDAALSSLAPASSRENPLRRQLGDEAYYGLAPLFTEVPFIRPLSRRGQLQTMIRYVQLNPQRLATKRLMPGFFRVQEGITIMGRTYSGVGNILLLHTSRRATVHVRSLWEKAAKHGDSQPLRDYMNGCIIAARQGTVMVSPFISEKEKAVKAALQKEQHPFIVLADNGFRDYYKPSGDLFADVAAGLVLILSPWPYDAGKRHICRTDCIALNAMAEEIAAAED